MQEKGMINRIFGGGMRKSEARSLSALRGSLQPRGGKKGHPTRVGGKRLSAY